MVPSNVRHVATVAGGAEILSWIGVVAGAFGRPSFGGMMTGGFGILSPAQCPSTILSQHGSKEERAAEDTGAKLVPNDG